MNTYFSTFTTGTQEIVKELLERRKAKITVLLDGLVVYESAYSEREIRNFRFLNNTFVLLRFFKSINPNVKSIERILSDVARDKRSQHLIAKNLPPRRKNFKIACSLENQTVPVDRNILKKLEQVILRARDLRLNVNKPDLEFWALVRREGYGFFGVRITYPYHDKSKRAKGELRSEIAFIMNQLSKPTPKDIMLDPFAGYGSIPLERAQSFPYREIIAVEKDAQLVSKLKQEVGRARKKIRVEQGDALELEKIQKHSIDKIVTDPPWGMYEETSIPLDEFYQSMLTEFLRVLKPHGVLVLLIGQIEVFEKVLGTFSEQLKVAKKYPILVSGKKATIYKLNLVDNGKRKIMSGKK